MVVDGRDVMGVGEEPILTPSGAVDPNTFSNALLGGEPVCIIVLKVIFLHEIIIKTVIRNVDTAVIVHDCPICNSECNLYVTTSDSQVSYYRDFQDVHQWPNNRKVSGRIDYMSP